MQYSKRQTISNRSRPEVRNIGPQMLRLRYTAILAIALPALAVAGCSDSLSGNDTTFAKVDEGYKNTLDAALFGKRVHHRRNVEWRS